MLAGRSTVRDRPSRLRTWTKTATVCPRARSGNTPRGGLVGKRYPWNVYVDDRHGVINHYRANFYNSRTFDYEDRYEEKSYHPDFMTGGYPYTAPVASFRPNDYGLYDMAGNVREWTATASGSSKTIKGGS